MKIEMPKPKLFKGGGSTFQKNFEKIMPHFGHSFVDCEEGKEGVEMPIFFIAGTTLVERNQVIEAKKRGKKIILRVDNILEDRKNRNTGMSLMQKYAELADVIVYQSEWAKRMLSPLIGNGVVIYNGVDTDIFYPLENSEKRREKEGLRILYSKNSRNETKQFHEVQYWWREYNLEDKNATLVLVGNFARDYLEIEHPFDFHNGENFEFHSMRSAETMSDIMRSCDIAFLPYQYDACSNTILEAQACGLPIIYSNTGGTQEIVVNGMAIDYSKTPKEMVVECLNKKKDLLGFRNKFDLYSMGEQYDCLFKTIFLQSYDV